MYLHVKLQKAELTSCSVTVESTFKKRESISKMLTYEAICAVVAVAGAMLGIPAIVVIGAIGTIILGIIAMTKNKADIVWAIAMIVIAVYLAISSM